MAKNIFAVATIIYLAVFGLLSIIWPEKVCDFYQRQYAKGLGDLKKWPAVARLTQFRPRASLFRLFGALSVCSSLLVAYAWLKG
jgi:hypothetical protein